MLAPGQSFDRYVVEAMIGQGGMGAVFRAHDTRLRRAVALKVLTGSFPAEARALLLREARIAATLNHPNVVMVFDVGEVDGVPFMAMELLDGRSLRHYVKNPPPMPQRLRWLLDMARGLEVAHRAGLVHRDIKPANVFVTSEGAKVLDFGLAKPTEAARANYTAPMPAMQPVAGTTSGTPRYMAPEQLFQSAVDPRVDQYSWALTAYELVTGVPARAPSFTQSTVFDLPSMDGIAPRVVDILRRALDPFPARRFASMADVVAALVPMCGPREATLELQAVLPRAVAAHRENPGADPDPNPAHLHPLVACALADLGREVGPSFREASIVVAVDGRGSEARSFVLVVAVDDSGRLRVVPSSIDTHRACGDLVGAHERAGGGRWKRLVVPIGPHGLDPSARIEVT